LAAKAPKMINEDLLETVKRLIEKDDKEALAKLVDEMRPADLADLIEHLDQHERLYIFKILEPEEAGEVLVEIEPPVQDKLLEELDTEDILEIVEELDSDDAADLVRDLPPERAEEIISTLREDVSEEIRKLLPYKEDTAGGIMGLEFVSVLDEATIGDAIEVLRKKADEVENLYHIWVVDRQGRLVGVVSLKDLLLYPRDQRIRDIMNPDVISVNVNADQEEVVHLVKKYDLVNIPVVDDKGRLVGRITHDDIIDVIEEEVDEDISYMAGVIDEEIAEESTLKISKARLPWLIVCIGGELISALVISRFETSLQKILALSFFFPVIMALGGSSGSQAAIIVVRGLATGDISMFKLGKRVWIDLKVALVNGLVCGIMLGLVIGTWLSNYELGLVVTIAVVLIVLNSGLIGSAVPIIFKKLNIDPALATGPLVTTANDILGLLIYLGLVTTYLRYAA